MRSSKTGVVVLGAMCAAFASGCTERDAGDALCGFEFSQDASAPLEIQSDVGDPDPEIAHIADMLELQDGRLVILDSRTPSLVATDAQGTVLSIQILSRGDGPGEFRMPLKLVSGREPTIGVLDYGAARVAWVDIDSGEFEGQLSLPAPGARQVIPLPSGEGFWVGFNSSAGAATNLATLISSTGEMLLEVGPLPDEDRAWGGGGITLLRDGTLVIASGQPGYWYSFLPEDGLARAGSEVAPAARPPRRITLPNGQVEAESDVGVWGMVALPEDRVLVMFIERTGSGATLSLAPRAHVFDRQGILLGEVQGEIGWPILPSSRSGHLLVVQQEPLPHINRVHLSEAPCE